MHKLRSRSFVGINFWLLASAFVLLGDVRCVAEEDKKPPFIGKWQSPKNGMLFHFSADGKLTVEMALQGTKKGTWKLNKDDEGKMKLALKVEGEKESPNFNYEIKDQNRLLLSIGEGQENVDDFDLKRVTKKIDGTKLIGRWKSSYKDEDIEESYLITRRKDGTGFSSELYIDHKSKVYTRDVYMFKWKILGELISEVQKDGDEEYENLFGSVTVSDDKLRYKPTGEYVEGDPDFLEDHRTTIADHKDPPAGYKMVSLDEFFDEEEEEEKGEKGDKGEKNEKDAKDGKNDVAIHGS